MPSCYMLCRLRPALNTASGRRYYSKADRLKGLFFENKQLYGAVIKDKKRLINSGALPNEQDYTSEMHWMLHQQNHVLKTIIARKAANGNGPQTRIETTVQPIETKTIPFNDDELKSILNYPLVCKKNDLVTTELFEKNAHLPSVSKVLQSTMSASSRFALKRWKLAKIAELGEEGFRKYQAEVFETGSLFHRSIDNFLVNRIEPEDCPQISHLWDSIRNELDNIESAPLLTETPLIHEQLRYKGIVDSVSMVQGKISVVEWKTSDKSKPTLQENFDAPVQLCAYLGALNADQRYDLTAHNGFLVVAYKDGHAANSFFMSSSEVRKYWRIWLSRLQEFWIRTRDGTLPEPI